MPITSDNSIQTTSSLYSIYYFHPIIEPINYTVYSVDYILRKIHTVFGITPFRKMLAIGDIHRYLIEKNVNPSYSEYIDIILKSLQYFNILFNLFDYPIYTNNTFMHTLLSDTYGLRDVFTIYNDYLQKMLDVCTNDLKETVLRVLENEDYKLSRII